VVVKKVTPKKAAPKKLPVAPPPVETKVVIPPPPPVEKEMEDMPIVPANDLFTPEINDLEGGNDDLLTHDDM
jgi:hypothetical protein